MERETVRYIKDMAYFSTLGLQIALSILIGYGFGWWLDHKVFNTNPWLTYVGLVFGIGAAVSNIVRAINKVKKM